MKIERRVYLSLASILISGIAIGVGISTIIFSMLSQPMPSRIGNDRAGRVPFQHAKMQAPSCVCVATPSELDYYCVGP